MTAAQRKRLASLQEERHVYQAGADNTARWDRDFPDRQAELAELERRFALNAYVARLEHRRWHGMEA